MANRADARGHLAGDEIDAYCRGQLTADVEEQVELHFLECADCQVRVRDIETLVALVRADPPPAVARRRLVWWRLPAAALVLCTLGVGWLTTREGSREGVPLPHPPVSSMPPASEVRAELGVRLSPPTRGSAAHVVTLGPEVARVRFQLDVREAGRPGSRFDIVLATSNAVLQHTRGVFSDRGGIVEVAVERSLLSPGPLLFDVRSPSLSVSLPFVVRHDAR